jgi:cerevisin
MVFTQDFQVENGAPWGLARISHRDKLSLGSFNKYLYDSEGGEGVTAYVVDTGINIEHDNFDGRAVWGKTIPYNDEDVDGNGHGTHCAGTIGSVTYGVAKKADIVAVKVLRSNGSGSMSDVIKGVEYVANDHIKNGKDRKASTANMSLGGGNSPTLDLAVNAAVDAGIHFAVAAGNEDQDACNSSPASAANPITVGASTLADDRAYFSNWGKCVDLFAPGLNILSTYIGSKSATAVLSGTSMASPHVCGLLTYFLSLQPDSDSAFAEGKIDITPAFLKAKLIEYGTKNVLSDIDANTPNVLIFNGAGDDLTSFWQSSDIEESASSEASTKDSLSLENIVENIVSEVEHFGLDSVRNTIKELL